MSLSPPPLKRRRLDTPEQVDDTLNDLSIYSWNVNGIDALLQPSISYFFGVKPAEDRVKTSSSDGQKRLTPLQVILARHGWPQCYFLQEVKIKPNDKTTMRAVSKAVIGHSAGSVPSYEAHFCLPSNRRSSRGPGSKVYGVCTLIRKDFASACVESTNEVDWDQEGRFLLTKTRKTDRQPKLAIFNAYMVNGTTLPYRNHITGETLGTRHDRKLEVHALLQKHCRELEQAGYNVIIAGDINIARATLDGYPNLRTFPAQHIMNRADFEQRFLATVIQGQSSGGLEGKPLGMVDTFRNLHPDRRGYSYYTRSVPFGESCDRVDMILASASLRTACVAAGMHETELDRGPSDHVPIYAKFSFGETASQQPAESA